MSEDSSPHKRCSKCGEMKVLEMFCKNKSLKDGRHSQCKACVKAYAQENAEKLREYHRAYREANAETLREQKREYAQENAERLREYHRAREANAEALREYGRAYFAANSEVLLAKQKARYEANKEKILGQQHNYYLANIDIIRKRQRAYYEANADTIRAYNRKFAAEHPELRLVSYHKRRALIKGNGGTYTVAEKRMLYENQRGLCAYCERSEKLTIDHIIPISKGGSNDISNICLACLRCNLSKREKTPEQWVNRWYLR
jgi:5-methylcytosine-specific restriction endonuclease McrA